MTFLQPFLELTIPGDPVAKGRPRVNANGHAFTPERTRMAEKAVTDAAIGAMAGRPALAGPVRVHVVFHCATNRRTDGDNLLKLVTDAMNQVVFVDDSQIEAFGVRVLRKVGKANAKTVIEVDPME